MRGGLYKVADLKPELLTIDSGRAEFIIDDPGGPWHGRRLWDLYREAHTPWEWHQPIFEAARAEGLACISTACDLESLEFLISLGVDAIKIASFELIHIPLLEAAAKCGRPVLLSTGMSSLEELGEAVATLRANRCNEFILLKCTSAYPSTEGDANILTMPDMRKRYGCDAGLSDHTLRPYTAFAATAQGAVVIEKHFTLARRDGGLDAAFSLEPAEMRELVGGTDAVWRSLGSISYGPLAADSASLKERPSVYVTRAMKKGGKISATRTSVSSARQTAWRRNTTARSSAGPARATSPRERRCRGSSSKVARRSRTSRHEGRRCPNISSATPRIGPTLMMRRTSRVSYSGSTAAF